MIQGKVIPLFEKLDVTKKPEELYADKAYDTFIVRWYLGNKEDQGSNSKEKQEEEEAWTTIIIIR
jgi:uncharacterized protein YcnI